MWGFSRVGVEVSQILAIDEKGKPKNFSDGYDWKWMTKGQGKENYTYRRVS